VTPDLHYRFPPASAYRLNRCLFALKSDPAFRVRYVDAPESAMDEMGLIAAEREALVALDRDALVARGAHPYLVFMAELRLRMDRSGAAFEHF
jgi:Aromatic-ring-opening dioxygenase LigAB, LigA subunit